MKKIFKTIALCLMVISMLIGFGGCGEKVDQKVVIYSNADDEAVKSISNSLDAAGYEGKYVMQSIGTSELGGKLMAEGENIEANLVTMSSYFIESAQQKHNMFESLNFPNKALDKYPDYYTPILANTGSIFINTNLVKEKGLSVPKSIKDLTKDEYKNLVSIPNLMNSSTGWLLIQSIISQYGEVEGKAVLNKLIQNCGPHIETSGSGPIKKVRAGEVAAGFGLRHQAVSDKVSGKPIDYVDPIEGNFSLTESVAVVKKKDTPITKLATEMAKVIVTNARQELIKNYPVSLYEGESVTDLNKPAFSKKFNEPLTVELLQKHQEFFKSAK
ncbi:extracellular solute-binding protein [Clostridium sporogenes]|uniref:extracellular solute-binding protein n=1 Tax=Clostridium sporogenes TaxID=1509 RepID=UPI0015EF98D0|nr:extracellular solute-binding protein [Clostridium sporogenes]MBA4508035.1 extracellular solute-binding protein [Clostridium sporogenes]